MGAAAVIVGLCCVVADLGELWQGLCNVAIGLNTVGLGSCMMTQLNWASSGLHADKVELG